MIVLSLFDGMSCGQLALQRANIKVDKYFASEIKKHAIELTHYHFPNTIQLGDITKLHYKDGVLYGENGTFNVGHIDLLIGGSPCQNFSIINLNNSNGLQGSKSRLFYEYLRLLNEVKPDYFLLENVKMKKEYYNQLNDYLGVKGIEINSKLVSYQNRVRYYWTNIPNVSLPIDKNINFQDYKETDYEICKQYKLNRTQSRERMWNDGKGGKGGLHSCKNITHESKILCITRKQDRCPNSGLIEFDDFCRYLTRKELELGQTLPVGYTNILSYNKAQDLIGDGWTVDVIAHILSFLNIKEEC